MKDISELIGFLEDDYPNTTDHVEFIQKLYGIRRFTPKEWQDMIRMGRTHPPFYGVN